MFPIDPKALAGQFTSAGQLGGFLVDLFGAVTFSPAELAPVLAALAGAKIGTDATGEPVVNNPELEDAIAASAGAAESRRLAKALVAGWN